MKLKQSNSWIFPAVLALLLLPCAVAFGASTSYYLNQTNADGPLSDGVPYLELTLEEAGTNLTLTLKTLPVLSSQAGSNYGIQSFGFNSSQSLASPNFTLPSGWSFNGANNQDGFGSYAQTFSGSGSSRVDPLVITISSQSLAAFLSSLSPSSGTAGQGNFLFAAHVAGFNDLDPGANELTSAWFAGSTPVPEPSTWLLMLAGMGMLVALGKRRKSC